jgi:hypothetical protein
MMCPMLLQWWHTMLEKQLNEALVEQPFLLLGLQRRHITHLGSMCSSSSSRWCRWWLSNRCHRFVEVGTLLKESSNVGLEILLLSLSLYFSFSLKSKMIQLAEPGPFFIIKDILYITMQTIKNYSTSILIILMYITTC